MARTNRLYVSPTEFVDLPPHHPHAMRGARGQGGNGSLTEIVATRAASIDFFKLVSNLYLMDPDPILRKAGKGITALRELKSDAHVAAVTESRKAGVLSRDWTIERVGTEGAAFETIRRVFDRLDVHRITREILEAPLFGFQPLEVMWERGGGDSGGDSNARLLPVDVVGKPPEWFRFGGDNNELLFRTKDNTAGEPVPEKKFLVARHNPSFTNPYGEKALSKCFWPVTFKKGGVKFWAAFTEKYGMPLAIAKLAPNASDDDMERSLDMLSNMVQDAVAVFRGDVDVDVVPTSPSTASVDIYERFINFNNTEISKAILGQTLTTELTGKTGSFAASRTHMEVRRDIVEMDSRLVESIFNTLIKWTWEVNFSRTGDNSARLPRFVLIDRDTGSGEDAA